MDGIGGKPGWAWIFILEGLLTVIAGAASFWIIQDFPDTAKFLTEEERTVVIRRLQQDDQFSAGGENLKLKYIWKSLLDWKTWVGSEYPCSVHCSRARSLSDSFSAAIHGVCLVNFFGVTVADRGIADSAVQNGRYVCTRCDRWRFADLSFPGPLYAFSLFLPSIINQLGFTATPANLLTVPVYVLACIVTCFVGWLADRYGQRGLINMYVNRLAEVHTAADRALVSARWSAWLGTSS